MREMDKEPSFIGIPKPDWMPVAMYMAVSGIVYFICAKLFPHPFDVIVFVWIAVGQGFLVKHNAIKRPYPKSLGGSLISFYMALFWPYYCHFKKPEDRDSSSETDGVISLSRSKIPQQFLLLLVVLVGLSLVILMFE